MVTIAAFFYVRVLMWPVKDVDSFSFGVWVPGGSVADFVKESVVMKVRSLFPNDNIKRAWMVVAQNGRQVPWYAELDFGCREILVYVHDSPPRKSQGNEEIDYILANNSW